MTPTSPAPLICPCPRRPAWPAASASPYAPPAALRERDDTDKVWAALNDPTKHGHRADRRPAVRAQLGECFGMPIGTNVEGKMVAALRRLGFDQVFDVDTAADCDHHGGGHRAAAPTEGRRHAAADHLLLSRLDQVLRALLPRICWITFPPARARSRCSAR